MSNAANDPVSLFPSSSETKKPIRSFILWDERLVGGRSSCVLLAAILYCVIWSLQAAYGFANAGFLTLDVALGLLVGLIALRLRLLPVALLHVIVVFLSLLLAWYEMSVTYADGNLLQGVSVLWIWFAQIIAGFSSTNNAGALFFYSLLVSLLLPYICVWILYRVHSARLVVALTTLIMIFNLNNLPDAFILFLFFFLAFALLLLVRCNLASYTQLWQKRGIRYADGMGWDLMQAGSLLSLGVLIFAALLPANYSNSLAASVWSLNLGPLSQLSSHFITNDANPPNHGNFLSSLVLGGNPDLNNDVVFRVTMNEFDPQYLAFVSYNNYQNGGWLITNASSDSFALAADMPLATNATLVHQDIQSITVVSPPGEDKPYLIGASAITSASLPTHILYGNDGVIAWLSNAPLQAGSRYEVTSSVSSADVATLRTVLLPADAPVYNPDPNVDQTSSVLTYETSLVQDYTQLPAHIDPRIHQLALQIVNDAHADTMYDETVALESYLRTHYSYSTNIAPPPGIDPVSWFLFENPQKDGFCNYFSSAMTLLARSLGIPARVVAGYTYGAANPDNGSQRTIRGSDAHTWVQIDFAGYGWINFEPSASFTTFARPLSDQYQTGSSASATASATAVPLPKSTPKSLPKDQQNQNQTLTTGSSSISSSVLLLDGFHLFLFLLTIAIVALLIWLFFWWRGLFRNISLTMQLYRRIYLLARWSGVELSPAQTPYEQLHTLTVTALPDEESARILERIGDIVVRERWADPASAEHPRSNGDIRELPLLWSQIRPRLMRHVARHPSFLLKLPASVWRFMRTQVFVWPHKQRADWLDDMS